MALKGKVPSCTLIVLLCRTIIKSESACMLREKNKNVCFSGHPWPGQRLLSYIMQELVCVRISKKERDVIDYLHFQSVYKERKKDSETSLDA